MTNVGRTAEKPTHVEKSEECVVWSEAYLPNYIHELASDDIAYEMTT